MKQPCNSSGLSIISILLFVFIIISLASCNGNKKVTIFEIGEPQDQVFKTMVNDFTICGEHWTEEDVKGRKCTDTRTIGREWITLYECIYNGLEYYKVRVYFNWGKVDRIEIKIEQNKMKNLHRKLKTIYGEPHRISLPRLLSWEVSTVYIGDIEGIIVTEDEQDVIRTLPNGTTTEEHSEIYQVIVVSGEQLYELKNYL